MALVGDPDWIQLVVTTYPTIEFPRLGGGVNARTTDALLAVGTTEVGASGTV